MQKNISFVVPTYRLRDVAETVEKYDENFWRNGHSLPIIIFDDSSITNQEKYYDLLESTSTYNDLFYVGPKEKEEFIAYLNSRLQDGKLESLVKNLFRPSYGGNRNYTLMYTLGELMVSADDDMRPYALLEDHTESLSDGEVSRGKYHKANQDGYIRKSFDILSPFIDVLGKPVSQVPENYIFGELVVDTAMDLETNATKGLMAENSLMLSSGKVERDDIVKMAQTFRSGTNDIDALDFVEMFLNDDQQTDLDELNSLYVLVNFRPVITNKNWRMDCGVAGYDNTFGLPPFFPTRLRFEDYIYRLWIQQAGIVAAHVDAAQTHTKNNYMRNPLAAEIFNEELANLLKKKIKSTLSHIDELSIKFDYDGEVSGQDSEEILSRITATYDHAINALKTTTIPARQQALQEFTTNLQKAFYGFEPDFFHHNLIRMAHE